MALSKLFAPGMGLSPILFKLFDFHRGVLDPTLFQRTNGKHLMLVQIYVGDIIFGSIDPMMVADFSKLMVDFGYGNDDANKGGGDEKVLVSKEDEEQFESESNLESGSSDEIAHPYALIEMQ
ncbi:unnamed protein product [Lactuca saligna]|uniref:Reverse transcriptase Ty1/copia-type domain-containing protein n=1 Tax=Lactuca saligna TaxID=75948 RepID=A0AA35V3Y2_LACSI|nr:unnamed protein product [Lactuca saligna]